MADDFVGPTLPPHLLKKKEEVNLDENREKKTEKPVTSDTELNETESIGPALPPNLKKPDLLPSPSTKKVYGPTFTEAHQSLEVKSNVESDDDEVIGPRFPSENQFLDKENSESSLEQRNELKNSSQRNVDKGKREEWMTALPEGRNSMSITGLNLQPRTFSKSGKVFQADETWIATPNSDSTSKTKKTMDKQYREYLLSEEKSQGASSEQRGPSLLDIHNQQQNKKRKEIGEDERRPFDREKDINVTFTDPSKKKKLFEQSKQLNSNFVTATKKWL
jgi:hypothetical protein